jgi:hypothetical protein
MNQKILVICHSQHQLEKAIYIQQILPLSVDVACIGHKIDERLKKVLVNVLEHESLQQVIPIIQPYNKFIFFSLVPSRKLFKLMCEIRAARKMIIAIQETHQIGMHLGVINNLIFSADIIFAASDLEKKFLDRLQTEAKIYSIGWLFQNSYKEFINSFYKDLTLLQENKYALVIFSAPMSITASSEESFQTRRNILQFVQKKYKNIHLILKLHPLENRELFKEYSRKNYMQDISFADETQSLWSLSKDASLIVVSNKTQAFLDLAEENKEFLIYQLGKENFISLFFRDRVESEELAGVRYYSLKDSTDNIVSFKKLHCKSEKEASNHFIKILAKSLGTHNPRNQMEIAAWNSFYGLGNDIEEIENQSNADLANNLKAFFDPRGNFDLAKLENQLESLSMRSAITLILMQKAIKKQNINTNLLVKFIENFFTSHIIQYFAIHCIRFEFMLNHQGLQQHIQPESIVLLDTTKAWISRKSMIMKGLFAMEKLARDLNYKRIKRFLYFFIDLSLRGIYTLRN